MKRMIGISVLAGLGPVAGLAQEAEPGGVFFTFDFAQTIEATTDSDLETTEEENDVEATTALSFGAVTETRTQRLSFDADTDIRISDGELTNDEYLTRLAYRRNSADANLEVSLQSRRSDISFLRDATDFINDDGEIELPDDFEDLEGDGIRTETVLAASLSWGETMPVGYSLSASQTLLRYDDTSAALTESDAASVSFGVRLNINEVTTGNITLGYAQTDEEGADLEESASLTGALTFARPRGDLTTSVTVSRDEMEDIFWAASVEREFALPTGTLSGALGVVEDEGGDPRLTGRIGFSYPLPAAQIDLNAVQSLSAGDDRATTTLSAAYTRELTPISSLRINVDFAQTSDPDGGDPLARASLSASYGYSLTENWQLTTGVTARLRDDDGTRTDSNSVFVTVSRPFSFRP